MQVVGDDLQVAVVEQGAGDGLGGGADVDEQRGVVRHQAGHGFGDALLLVAHLVGAHGVGGVLDARIVGRTAVVAAQQSLFGELVDVAADGLRGDREHLRHLLDAQVTALADLLDDALLSGGRFMGCSRAAGPGPWKVAKNAARGGRCQPCMSRRARRGGTRPPRANVTQGMPERRRGTRHSPHCGGRMAPARHSSPSSQPRVRSTAFFQPA